MSKKLTYYPSLSEEMIKEFQESLIQWWFKSIFKKSKRNFFWRKWILDPQDDIVELKGNFFPRDYGIFCVETVLQLTRAKNVDIHFKPFFNHFHSFQGLLSADNDHLKQLLTPLGRLSQNFRNLLDRTEIIVSHYNSKVPDNKEKIRKLMKTAKRRRHIYFVEAIALYIHGIIGAPVDVNVERIFKRVFDVTRKNYGVQDDLEFCNFVEKLVHQKKPVEYNLGLLDLGALICTTKKPKCLQCPLYSICKYRKKYSGMVNKSV